jgi:hypothetical protein
MTISDLPLGILYLLPMLMLGTGLLKELRH